MKATKLEYTRVLLECAAHIAVVLAIPFFFIQQAGQERSRVSQQAEQQRTLRADSAMRFIQMANDSERTQVRATLSEPWERIDVGELMRTHPTEAGLTQAKTAVTRGVRDRDIETLTEFYKAVLLCRNRNHCDSGLIDDFFRTDVAGFYCAYEHRLQAIARRLNREDYSADLLAYVGSCN